MNSNSKKSESGFIFNGKKKEFLDWLESLRISKYWLDTMSPADSNGLFREIHQVLKNFKELDLDEKEKLFALIEIDSCLHGAYEKLHGSYQDGKLPLNKGQQDNAGMVMHTYMELAQAYYEIMLENKNKKHKLSDQHLALTACKGLQGLGMVFLTASELYISPPKGFWLSCYHLFSLSEEFNLLDNKVKIDNAIYSAAVLFKKLIIFFVLDKNKLTPTEMEKVFQSLLRGINHIQSYILSMTDVSSHHSEIFGFSLNKDEHPTLQHNVPLATAKLLRYVEKYEIIKIVQFLLHEAKQHPQSTSINPELCSRILTTLEHQKHKRERRITKQYACRAVIGIDNLIDFLLEKEGRNNINQNKKTVNELEDDLNSLQLIFDWESEKNTPEDTIIVDNLKILDSSIGGYSIYWNSSIVGKLQVGEVIGVIPGFNSSKKGIETGLIRRIKVVGNDIIFGVELIGLESTLIYIERANSSEPGEWVQFLFGSPNYDVGVLCHKDRNYQTGEPIFVQLAEKKVPCYFGAVLNSTPLLEHITLSY